MRHIWLVLALFSAACAASDELDVSALEPTLTNDCFTPDPAQPAPAWAAGRDYRVGARVSFAGVTYDALVAHHAIAGWTPAATPTLWVRPTPCGLTPWAAQTRYLVGSEVSAGGRNYEAVQAHISQTGWAPIHAAALWRVLPDAVVVEDQRFDAPVDLGADINEGFRMVAQTYTAGVTGKLYGVAVDVFGFGTFPLRVSIRGVSGGAPSDTILGTTQTSANDSPLAREVRFATAIPQVAGYSYAIVVDYPGAPPQGAGRSQGIWSGATGNLYPAGGLFFSNDGHSWVSQAEFGFDVHFATYVATP
jgi:hypothetical protein